MPSASLVLPFVVPVKERVSALSSSMEIAVIMLLAEAKRKKRSLLVATEKRLVSISKLYYPLWAVPWENGSLILDGLDTFSSVANQYELPDVSGFLDEVESNKTRRDQFYKTLETHDNTFSEFAKTDQVGLGSLIQSAELLSAIAEYVKYALAQEMNKAEAVVLVPMELDQATAIENAERVRGFYRKVRSEVEALEYAFKLARETAQFHEQMVLKEIEFTKSTYEAEISQMRPAIEEKLDQLEKEREARIAKMNRIAENELKAKERERERFESELQKLELNKANYERRLEARKRRNDRVGAAHWEHRVKVDKNKIAETKSRIRSLSEFIEKEREQNQSDTEKLRFAYQNLIDQEKRKISEIEFQRDEKIQSKQREINVLQGKTRAITSQLDRLIARKHDQEARIKRLAVPLSVDDVTLICLPFYLTCYKTAGIEQCEVLPPVKLFNSAGVIDRLRKTIRNLRPYSGLAIFSQAKSKSLSSMLSSVIERKMKSDRDFNKDLMEAASTSNILERLDLKETLSQGIEELKNTGWIGTRQGDALLRIYA